MKTKLITFFLALLVGAGTMYAQSFRVGYLVYFYSYDSKTATVARTIQDFDKYVTSIEIPDSVEFKGEYYRVSAIAEKVFFMCSKLTSVTIGGNVERIGKDAFYSCSGLTSLVLPNSVVNIEDEAFFKCTGLTSVTMGCNVKRIGKQAFRDCKQVSSLNIPNSVVRIEESAFEHCSSLTAVTIPHCVDSIGKAAFAVCSKLESVTIGENVKDIGQQAFTACFNIKKVTCMALNPPKLHSWRNGDYGFENVSTVSLYVPAESVAAYRSAEGWKAFNSIQPISAEQTETNTVKAEPTEYSVLVIWSAVIGAYSYELVIRDKKGNVICTLIFNAQGQLISIAFNAPARNNESQQTQSSGFAFTVTGLEPGTQYSYSITAKNASGATLHTETGTFTTKALEALDQITNDKCQMTNKVLRDGQIFILRGDKTYTLTGQEL